VSPDGGFNVIDSEPQGVDMETPEALGILSALANGVHPTTGEVFPPGSPYQEAEVVRALFVATRALENGGRQTARARDMPGNVGKPWTGEEDQRLLAAFDAGQTPGDIARLHQRTVGGIEARLVKHGRIAAAESGVRMRGAPSVGATAIGPALIE
jgi:hypothetical protein